ncbi:AgmX/PglI C-terminal domain-containing protein [Corallococcus sp. M34]|uniref:AgmX/PglI C-terminal domain-containing protein n=1 Tax=Citreicoccus inhibens TaxID=2849499 RepID=UPI001C233797|nr:AgmX/PglI C-terminal domain-containing protein [Citreicoccus inhibens]MBU8894456.1 AgmX/PglI C-terminal domain-containing protein [Citreicoccus inhibens]
MSGQPTVLQVVILRDGLLVGTEVFIPGTYALGSDPSSDLRLDDPTVGPRHAVLYFQNGRTAIQDAGSATGVFVNGHRVSACEIRSVDEVLCGPFVLKTRVLAQRPPEAKPQPPPEVAALLGSPAPAPGAPQPPAAARQIRPTPSPVPPTSQPLAATVPAARVPLSIRPPTEAPQAPVAAPPAMAPVRAAPQPVPPQQPMHAQQPMHPQQPMHAQQQAMHAQQPMHPQQAMHAQQQAMHAQQPAHAQPMHAQQPIAPVPPNTVPSVRRRSSPEPEATESGLLLADDLLADMPPMPVAQDDGPLLRETALPTRPTHAPRIEGGKGAPQLYLDLYWGAVRRDARRFAPDAKKPVLASQDETAPMPLWGFTLPQQDAAFVLAESRNGAFRLYVPPGTDIEKASSDGRFAPITTAALESDGSRRFITLRQGAAARLTQGQMSLVAYSALVPERVFVNPLKGLPWLTLALLALFGGGLGAFIVTRPKRSDTADFTQKNLPPVALRLIAPEPKKKEEAKKKLEAIKKKAEPVKEKVVEKAPPKPVKEVAPPVKPPPQVENKALKALAKLSAAGPPANDLLAAVDKLGSGPGSKNVKTSNYKLSGLIGKAPIANAGTGIFGLGGGGKGGGATLGAELLRGKGGGGIGALGAGSVGKGAVGGTVTRATARSISSTQGTVDREAVAKVINSHLQDVHSCYERALLKDPGLAGKVVLEWSIGLNGSVTSAKTKSSTLRNASVEACILSSLKTWTFPAPKGGIVIITYPFLFNSVGY